jgi:FkbM family methyltransferase
VRDYRAASTMTVLGLDRHAFVYDRSTRTYWIRELDLCLPPAHHHLLPGLWDAVELKRAGVSFANCGNEIIAHTGAFSVAVHTQEELFILMEIIANGVYNMVSSEGAVVLDVGMNVGFASLYFAAQPWVRAVWSYEPVADTYARALRNLERNPTLAAKIRPHNYGLSDGAGEMTFDFCTQWRGAVGVYGLSPDFRRSHGVTADDISRITVQVQSVSDTVRELRAAYPEAEVIMKVDCEGAEYTILAELRCAGLLRDIDAFLIEWHERGFRELEQVLVSAGFFVLSFTPRATTTGMVYAYKRALAV